MTHEPTMPTLSPTTTVETTTVKSKMTTKKTTQKSKKTPPKKATATEVPDICNSSIDAISVIRREIFVFKGNVSNNDFVDLILFSNVEHF